MKLRYHIEVTTRLTPEFKRRKAGAKVKEKDIAVDEVFIDCMSLEHAVGMALQRRAGLLGWCRYERQGTLVPGPEDEVEVVIRVRRRNK